MRRCNPRDLGVLICAHSLHRVIRAVGRVYQEERIYTNLTRECSYDRFLHGACAQAEGVRNKWNRPGS
jgi:hypothetical protein